MASSFIVTPPVVLSSANPRLALEREIVLMSKKTFDQVAMRFHRMLLSPKHKVNFKHKVEHHGRFGWRSTNRIAGKLVIRPAVLLSTNVARSRKDTEDFAREGFFRGPKRFAYTISPDGKKLAFLKSSKSHLKLCVRSISEKRQRLITRQVDSLIDRLQEALQFGRSSRVEAERNRDIATYFWKNNRFILFLRKQHRATKCITFTGSTGNSRS